MAGISISKLAWTINSAVRHFQGEGSLEPDTSRVPWLQYNLIQGVGHIAFWPNLDADAHGC